MLNTFLWGRNSLRTSFISTKVIKKKSTEETIYPKYAYFKPLKTFKH